MTQSFFQHMQCRKLKEQLWILEADYTVICYTRGWWALAAVASAGIIIISVGAPVGMFIWMRKKYEKEMHKVRFEGKARITAYRDFERKFSFMSREFTPGTMKQWHAGCCPMISDQLSDIAF